MTTRRPATTHRPVTTHQPVMTHQPIGRPGAGSSSLAGLASLFRTAASLANRSAGASAQPLRAAAVASSVRPAGTSELRPNARLAEELGLLLRETMDSYSRIEQQARQALKTERELAELGPVLFARGSLDRAIDGKWEDLQALASLFGEVSGAYVNPASDPATEADYVQLAARLENGKFCLYRARTSFGGASIEGLPGGWDDAFYRTPTRVQPPPDICLCAAYISPEAPMSVELGWVITPQGSQDVEARFEVVEGKVEPTSSGSKWTWPPGQKTVTVFKSPSYRHESRWLKLMLMLRSGTQQASYSMWLTNDPEDDDPTTPEPVPDTLPDPTIPWVPDDFAAFDPSGTAAIGKLVESFIGDGTRRYRAITATVGRPNLATAELAVAHLGRPAASR